MSKTEPEQIGYAYEIQENIPWQEIREAYPEEVCLWIWAGTQAAGQDSTCFTVMEYHGHTRLLQKCVSHASPARAGLSTVLDALRRIRTACRICLISALQIGTATAMKGKSKNQDLFDELFTLLQEKNCTLTEVYYPGGSETICSRICEADPEGSARAFFNERRQKRDERHENTSAELLRYRREVEQILLRHNIPEAVLKEIRSLPIP